MKMIKTEVDTFPAQADTSKANFLSLIPMAGRRGQPKPARDALEACLNVIAGLLDTCRFDGKYRRSNMASRGDARRSELTGASCSAASLRAQQPIRSSRD